MRSKVIAMYLPQYHEVPENNEFWGEGFTDWVGVKNAKPLFDGHEQPRIPLNNNYYDLSNVDSIRWQASIARKYGVYGFGIYHYWFSSEKQMLTKPAELILENKNIGINFLFAWDNASWKRTWSKIKGNAWSPLQDENKDIRKSEVSEILIEYKLGQEDEWKKHFEYLLPYFKDDRYIKDNRKPVFIIYNYDKNIYKMADYWDMLSKEAGFDGIKVIYRFDDMRKLERGCDSFFYEPIYSGWGSICSRAFEKIKNKLFEKLGFQRHVRVYLSDSIWKRIIHRAETSKSSYSGAFVSYDDTPRRGKTGTVVRGTNPTQFGLYMEKLLRISSEQQKKFIFLTAWNEWGEGAYLEPDETHGYAYLEALKRAIDSCSE